MIYSGSMSSCHVVYSPSCTHFGAFELAQPLDLLSGTQSITFVPAFSKLGLTGDGGWS